jgi:hypothetical protein
MKDFWNQRYLDSEYAYGVEPNRFLKEQLSTISKGKTLFPAEGEGRNAVYAAQQGFEVFAFDSSIEGKKKAVILAEKQKVTIEYNVTELDTLNYPENYFDTLILIFAHFPSEIRKQYHQKLLSYLKPNGSIIFEAFSKEQIHLNSGGPKQIEMLFSEEEIRTEFPNIDFVQLETVEVNIDEGPFHQGRANVVRFLGTKKE